MKLGPCILLTYLSLTLIQALIEVDKRKARLQNRSGISQDEPSSNMLTSTANQTRLTTTNNHHQASHQHHGHRSDRTNQMLLAILLLFLLTEFPSGILGLLSGILGEEFFSMVYSPLGEVLDILALVNSSINFILYCTTSSIFRQTFCKLFCPSFNRFRSDTTIGKTMTTTATTATPTEQRTTIIHIKSQDHLDTCL